MDNQNFLLSFIQADRAKKHLQEKQIEVEDNFAAMQAVMGWLMDNPWLYALFLQNEVIRRDVLINERVRVEINRLRKEAVIEAWNQVRKIFCEDADSISVTPGRNDQQDVMIKGLSGPKSTPPSSEIIGKSTFLLFLQKAFISTTNGVTDKDLPVGECPDPFVEPVAAVQQQPEVLGAIPK